MTVENTAAQPMRAVGAVPEIYVDGYQGVTFKDGVVKLNCYSLALDPATNVTYREAALRMTMSAATLVQTHQALGALIADLERSGVLRRG